MWCREESRATAKEPEMKRLLSKLIALSVAAFAALSLSGCGSREGQADVIKIASSLPRTGSAKAQTDTIVNGIKMALDEVEWRVGDFTIDYLDLDDATAAAGGWTAEAEAANADRAAKNPDVMAYIGAFNSGASKI